MPGRDAPGARKAWCREPALDDLFEDPLTRLLMARDGVEEGKLRSLLDDLGQKLIAADEDEGATRR
ncbi:MAG: hypothetical protein JO010_08370 [Alphaproteobacteria bacterium]|nr:hypothetical protein [Alphaproteobacteria bacterium]